MHTPTTETSPLSLHDALPIFGPIIGGAFFTILRDKVSSYVDWYFIVIGAVLIVIVLFMPRGLLGLRRCPPRSEEHTSELQSLTNLVCRLLLEKKKRENTIRLW